MNAERWKQRALPSVVTAAPPASQQRPESPMGTRESVDMKKPRVLTKALRTLSSSSLESIGASPSRSSSSARRLQKTPSNSSSMIERLHRRVSRDSGASNSISDGTPSSPIDQPFSTMDILHYGHLKVDISLLKARSEFLVLTDHCLVKFSGVEAARGAFPQLMTQAQGESRDPPSSPALGSKAAAADIRLEVPLRSIVAVFNEEGSSPRFGIEVWWSSPWPRLAYCKAHFFFALPKERDDWLASVQRACRVRSRRGTAPSVIPENLKARINHIVASTEPSMVDGSGQHMTFPVAKRSAGPFNKEKSAEEPQLLSDVSSFYLVIGSCMIYLIEVLRADHMAAPGELRVKVSSFGTVTLTRFKATIASHEQRFVMSFRAPFGRETRFDLASTQYRRIIEALMRVDRTLKPMWPQQFQQITFDIHGLPPPLQLTAGNDLGGIEKSLQAYCIAFNAKLPRWTIEWNAPSLAVFRLLSTEGVLYSATQLLACFRALRYNSFFKAISLRDVDISALAGKRDYSQYGDTVVHTSLTGHNISEEHHEILSQSPVLTQEIHALLFASDSIRSVDFTNVFGSQMSRTRQARVQSDHSTVERMTSEVVRPVLMLLRRQLCCCRSLSLGDNPLAPHEVDDLANLIAFEQIHLRKLDLARCRMGDAGLAKVWTSMAGQALCLETIDTSDNQGSVKFDIIHAALAQLRAVKKLRIAKNTRLATDASLFEKEAINSWELQELDVSGIALNDATIDVLANYLQTAKSQNLEVLRLDMCGLTGRQVAKLFRSMGQARHITVHISASRLDDGIDDLCGAIACGYGPWSLFMQMIEFLHETNYVKLWRAMSVNKSIECLSTAGSATPDAVSDAVCEAVSNFFEKNETVRYLDISGYDSKLDEGRLGPQFSKALIGIRSNSRIEHLRVRSQMLNINIGDLAEAISGNRTLHTLDCEGNDFNLSNFKHLVKHLEENSTVRYFSAFSDLELSRNIRKSVESVGQPAMPTRRTSVMSRLRPDKPEKASNFVDGSLVQQLRGEWDVALSDLQRVMERNQKIHETSEQSDDESLTTSSSASSVKGSAFTTAFGGLALREWEARRGSSVGGGKSPVRRGSSRISVRDAATVIGQGAGGISRSYSVASSEIALSPTSDGASSDSGARTPPETDSQAKEECQVGDASQSPEVGPEVYFDAQYTLADTGVEDQGLRMKSHRRFQSDLSNRIDEED